MASDECIYRATSRKSGFRLRLRHEERSGISHELCQPERQTGQSIERRCRYTHSCASLGILPRRCSFTTDANASESRSRTSITKRAGQPRRSSLHRSKLARNSATHHLHFHNAMPKYPGFSCWVHAKPPPASIVFSHHHWDSVRPNRLFPFRQSGT